MKRLDAALAIRAYLGDRLVHYDQWGSRFDYDSDISRSSFTVEQMVNHYHGASAQLPRIQNDAKIYGPDEAERRQMRYVDYIHFVSRGWAHGFAYCLGDGPLTGKIYEGRSAWFPHGAHFEDYPRDDFPLYHCTGRDDTHLTEAQIDVYWTVKEMLHELFGMNLDAITDHGNVPGNSTSCAGQLWRQYIVLDLQGVAPRGNDFPTETQEEDPVSALPILKQTWFRPGDGGANDYVRLLQSNLNLLDYIEMDHGINYNPTSGKFDGLFGPSTRSAVESFQADHGLMVDGKVGNYTWTAMFESLGG